MDDEIRDLERRLLLAKSRVGQQRYVIVRTKDAGAHAGLLESMEPVTLTESRRLWHWKGAATLSEVAMDGVNSAQCRFGCKVRIILLDAIEIIDASPEGRAAIEAAPIWRPNGG